MKVTFLGVSTLLFDDGETAILTDGFFTRPGKLRTLIWKIAPKPKVIARCLERAKVRNLKAVIVLHSHYDHAFDAPVVARQTGAQLIGSESTANIARGYGLPEQQITVIKDGQSIPFGRFNIIPIPSVHSPLTLLTHIHIHRVLLKGDITRPLQPPAWWTDYKEGGCYAMHIEHDGRSMLVQGSGGFKRDTFSGVHAEVVFLGIGTLGKLDEDYRGEYWRQTVSMVGAKRVIPIHWDDFFRSLDRPLVPMSRSVDDFDKTMEFLRERGRQEQVEVKLLREWVETDPFAGLEGSAQ